MKVSRIFPPKKGVLKTVLSPDCEKFDVLLDKAMNLKPHTQRLAIGLSGLLLIPLIDMVTLSKLPEDEKYASVAKSIAKVIIGTATGVIVRKYALDLIKKYTEFKTPLFIEELKGYIATPKEGNKSKLLPESFFKLKEYCEDELIEIANNHAASLSTWFALVIMLVTNFIIDAPLTVILTNLLGDKCFDIQARKAEAQKNFYMKISDYTRKQLALSGSPLKNGGKNDLSG